MPARVFSKKVVVFLLTVLISVSAEVLDLAKKSVYDLGTGESLVLKLDFPKGSQYEFTSADHKPFALKKISANKIEITFEAAKLNARPAEKQTYQSTFTFTKSNTGRKSTLTVKAAYVPPVSAATAAAATQPVAKAAGNTVAEAQKQSQQTAAEMQQTAAKAEQVAQSVGMAPAVDTVSPAIAQVETVKVMVPAAPAEAPFPWLYVGIIGFLLLIVIILLIKQMVPKHSPASSKYEEFYKDAATILDVNIKGRSIDNCAEEIIQALMELIQKENGPVALIKGVNGVEKMSINGKQNSTNNAADNAASGLDSSMSSQFIDPNYNNAFNGNFDTGRTGGGTLRTKNAQGTSTISAKQPANVSQAEELSYENPLDYLSAPSTNSFDPALLNKIHREIKAEETPQEQESIEEKRKKIEEMLGKKKFD